MTQAERDRLVALKKAKKKLITQKEAAEELGITERHVRRLLQALKRRGDKAVVHALRGLPSNRKISADTEQEAVAILSRPVYRGFGPTLAAEYLNKKHGMEVGRETVRQWMMADKLWRAPPKRVEKVHQWRPRRSRFGDLVASRPIEDESGVVPGTTATRRPPDGGPVGHQHPCLVGGPRRRDGADQHDRRCDQPLAGAVCQQRLDRGKHESAGALLTRARPAAGLLHR